MSIKNALNATIRTLLSGSTNASTRVYSLIPPDNPTLPYIVFDYVNEADDNDNPNRSKQAVMFIRAYATTGKAADTIDAQIDTLLHNQVLTITGWSNFQTRREDGFSFVEVDDAGRKVYMSGANYRIRADQ